MAEPAKEIKSSTVDTEGLEPLFQVDLEPKDQDQIQFQVDLVPLAEAAKRLGVSRRYAQKLVTTGKIPAIKDGAGRWLVKVALGQIQIQDQVEQIEFQDQIQMEPASFQIQDQVIQGYQDQVRQLQEKLEAATYRVGYLQAQLESSKDTIKLLTDNQHKSGWWTRFCSWFKAAPAG